MQIAFDYGERLNIVSKSLHQNALGKLIGNYPSQGFVIDRKEAKELFNNVHSPDEETSDLYLWAREIIKKNAIEDEPIVIDVGYQLDNESKQNECINTEKPENTCESTDSRNEGDSGEPEQESSNNEPDNAKSNKK